MTQYHLTSIHTDKTVKGWDYETLKPGTAKFWVLPTKSETEEKVYNLHSSKCHTLNESR